MGDEQQITVLVSISGFFETGTLELMVQSSISWRTLSLVTWY